jgi:hypothetical protein
MKHLDKNFLGQVAGLLILPKMPKTQPNNTFFISRNQDVKSFQITFLGAENQLIVRNFIIIRHTLIGFPGGRSRLQKIRQLRGTKVPLPDIKLILKIFFLQYFLALGGPSRRLQ